MMYQPHGIHNFLGTECDDDNIGDLLEAFKHSVEELRQEWVLLMRGIPGSGKSSLVGQILNGLSDGSAAVCSADHFFIDSISGRYSFDHSLIEKAHACCRQKFTKALKNRTPLVVLDNTCIREWEYKAYENAALKAGYSVCIVELRSTSTNNTELAVAMASRNTHGVPVAKIEDMLGRWEEDIRCCTVQIGGLAKPVGLCAISTDIATTESVMTNMNGCLIQGNNSAERADERVVVEQEITAPAQATDPLHIPDAGVGSLTTTTTAQPRVICRVPAKLIRPIPMIIFRAVQTLNRHRWAGAPLLQQWRRAACEPACS